VHTTIHTQILYLKYTYTHAHTHAHIHIHTHTYTYTYTHTHARTHTKLTACTGGRSPIVQPNYGVLSVQAAVHRGATQRLVGELLQRLGVHILSGRPIKVLLVWLFVWESCHTLSGNL